MLKNVVLPAPLGPMIETIALSGTANVTSLQATRPPKTFDTFMAARIEGPAGPPPPSAGAGGGRGAPRAPARGPGRPPPPPPGGPTRRLAPGAPPRGPRPA